MDKSSFYKIITGKNRGIATVLVRPFLRVMSLFYSVAVRGRNFCYEKGWLKQHQPGTTVICIGNITAGGTGKTPLVIWVYNFLVSKGLRCAILTRGYKTPKGKFSDEPAILAKSCPEAKVIIEPDRVAGVAKAIEQSDAEVVIMDDGFQHRRLTRNLDIVAIDAICPFGYGRLLPSGLLREPVSSLSRANAVVITRSDQVSREELEELDGQLKGINSSVTVAKALHAPLCAKVLKTKNESDGQTSGPEISIEELKNKSVYAFCGIGNPDAFMTTLKQLGLNVVASKIYDDHHRYVPADIDDIYEEARYLNVDIVLTTEKDWTKTALMASSKKNMPLAYLMVRLQFIEGEKQIIKLIEKVSSVTTKPV